MNRDVDRFETEAVEEAVVLTPEGRNRRGADVDVALDVLREVDAQERVVDVRHRVDAAVEQVRLVGAELLVGPLERDQAVLAPQIERVRDLVRVGPGTVDHPIEADLAAVGADRVGVDPALEAGPELDSHRGTLGS